MKKLTMLLLLLMLTSMLWANGQQEQESGEPATKTEKLTILKAGAESAWDEYYKSSFERFKAANPDLNIEFEYSSVGWAEANTKINLMYAGGSAPDIIAAA